MKEVNFWRRVIVLVLVQIPYRVISYEDHFDPHFLRYAYGSYDDSNAPTSEFELVPNTSHEFYSQDHVVEMLSHNYSPPAPGSSSHNPFSHNNVRPESYHPHQAVGDHAISYDTKSLFLLDPTPYQIEYSLVNFSPTTPAGKLVARVVNQLKINRRWKFFNHAGFGSDDKHYQGGQLMFCLSPSNKNLDKFLTFYNDICVQKQKSRRSPGDIINRNRNDESRDVWKFFHDKPPEIISNYKKSISDKWEGQWEALKMRFDVAVKNGRSKFAKMDMIFPLYLFHVDIISAILPIRELDEGLLAEQRGEAGKLFLELTRKVLSGEDGDEPTVKEVDRILKDRTNDLVRKKTSTGVLARDIICHALDYWISRTRKIPFPEQRSYFDTFIHDLRYSVL